MAQPATPTDDNGGDYLDQLARQGWAHLPGFLGAELAAGLRREALQSNDWTRAGIGAGGNTHNQIRRDNTYWLNGDTPLQAEYLALMEQIRCQVNQRFFAGLFEYEAHFAHYPAGAFYRKHRDNLLGKNARLLTSVAYLNPCWRAGDGGELVLYNETDSAILATLPPRGGDLLLFWSEDFPHEVLPAVADRYSIAGWFRKVHASPAR